MPITITMPRLSDTMEEGTLNKWRVKVGDAVKSGDILADVETDKATMELQAFDEGTVAKLVVNEGQVTKVGNVILVLAQPGEKVEDAAKAAGGPSAAEGKTSGGESQAVPEEAKPRQLEPEGESVTHTQADQQEEPLTHGAPEGSSEGEAGRLRVSPLARKLAEEAGLDVTQIQGTGPDGRIIKRDIEAAKQGQPRHAPRPPQAPGAPSPAQAPAKPQGQPAPALRVPQAALNLQSKVLPLSGMRKTIAKRLVESKVSIPHFTVSMTVSMDALMSLRETLNQQLGSQGVKLSVNDFLVRGAALALLGHPVVNSSWAEEGIRQHGAVNIGVAVALPEEKGGGLVVPVIRDAHGKGLRHISIETRDLAEKARTRGLTAEEMDGGTFTLSNLGMFGVDHFEAIINPPQAAILAIGAALQKPVVRDGQLAVGTEMTLTLSADHRVVDGAAAAAFLQTLKQMLENPAVLLV